MRMEFFKLAEYLEKLEKTSSRNEMTVILAEMFSNATPEEGRLIAYLTQGQLGPAYDTPNFAVAEKMMMRALGEDAERLFKVEGDLGRVAEEVKRQKSKGESKAKSLEVIDVYDALMQIAKTEGEGSQEKKLVLIGELLECLDGLSAKYVVRMILGKLRTGFSDMTVLDSLSWMITGDKKLRAVIEGMYNVRADLGEVVGKVKSQKAKIISGEIDVEPKIGTPILMAKAERAVDAEDIWERNGRCAGEYKLDGLRIQAHVNINSKGKGQRAKVILFSRGMENVTEMYPDIVEGLAEQMTEDCIVEGEMIAEDGKGKFLPFQQTTQRKRKYDIEEMRTKIPLVIYLFDVLVVADRNVMNRKNEERREELVKLVKKGKTVKLIERETLESVGDIESFFLKSMEAGTEGIIAKKLDGPYRPGGRDFNWIKYKKSYDKSTLNDTVDAVVMGYDYGQGKRADFGIGGFLVGIYQPETEKYLTVAKIGTGLSDEEWKEMKLKIQKSQVKSKPEKYRVKKEMGIDVWYEPAIVMEVKTDEISKSTMHSSGYALRFPRFIKYREKKPIDSTSLREIINIYGERGTKDSNKS